MPIYEKLRKFGKRAGQEVGIAFEVAKLTGTQAKRLVGPPLKAVNSGAVKLANRYQESARYRQKTNMYPMAYHSSSNNFYTNTLPITNVVRRRQRPVPKRRR